jgi:UDPglucose 6-dehydrogenase
MTNAGKILTDVEFCKDAYDAATGADAVVTATEWTEFKELNLPKLRKVMRSPLLIDFRNLYSVDDVKNDGFEYWSIGRRTDAEPNLSQSLAAE